MSCLRKGVVEITRLSAEDSAESNIPFGKLFPAYLFSSPCSWPIGHLSSAVLTYETILAQRQRWRLQYVSPGNAGTGIWFVLDWCPYQCICNVLVLMAAINAFPAADANARSFLELYILYLICAL